jgi:exosortase A-associated hydrolase 1
VSRRHFAIDCHGARLAGTLDEPFPGRQQGPAREAGLLLVSGGNETRAGAFSGQARLAARIAAQGYPVLRYDRRGVGDSEGVNMGFRHAHEDIEAARKALRTERPDLQRIVAFGNCDAASALMLAGSAGCDALVLSNPWTYDDEAGEDAAPPPAAIRSRYLEKLTNPREVWRLLTGGVDLRKLARGLRSAAGPASAPSGLAGEMQAGLAAFEGPARFLVAERDRTGQAFLAAWDASDRRIARCAGADHAYSDKTSQDWLVAQILAALADE